MKPTTLHDYTERILRVLIHIQQNLDDDLALDGLARIAFFSPFHFHRVFRGMVGESVKSHIRRLRLERAASRLKQGDRPVTAIAFEAGYETHESFTRAFRALWGESPSLFRSNRNPLRDAPAPSGVHYDAAGNVDRFTPHLSKGEKMEVKIETIEPIRVAFMRHTGPYNQCGPTWDRLCAFLGPEGMLGPGSRLFGLSYDDPDVTPPDKIRYDACIEVDENFLAEGDVGVQTVAGGRFAVTTHFGPYDRLNETYAKIMGEWLPRSGETLRAAPSIEFYLNDPESTEPEDLVTDIYTPLE